MAGKRGHGEGSVYWRASRERWVAAATLPDGRTREHQCKTKREAQEWLNKTLLAIQQGTLATGPQQTVATFLEQWLQDTAKARVRPSTFYRYQVLMNTHAIPALGKLPLQKLTPQHLQRFYTDKLDSGLAPATVAQIHRILHRALKDAMRWDLIGRNPCDLVDTPRGRSPEIRPLNEEQVIAFLKAAREDPLEALWVLAVTTGMRQGELLGLKWEDLAEDTRSLSVRRSLQYLPGAGYIVQEPKSTKGRRRIALGPLAIMALNRHRERQRLQREFAGEQWEDTGLVFTNTCGRALDASNLTYKAYRPLLARAGLPRIRFHDLRHTAGTMLLSQGTHPKIVQEILGHSTISITMDTYSHVLPGLQEEAVERMHARLSAAAAQVDPEQIAGRFAGLAAKAGE
jgi:integrase